MKTYMEQIETLASDHEVPVEAAFDEAGVERSTLRRSRKGLTHLRHDTAEKIAEAIIRIAARQDRARDQSPAVPAAANAGA